MADPDEPLQVSTQIGGFAIVPIWVLGVGLTGAELAVYVSLRSFADRQGRAFPHIPTIAARANVTDRTVFRALARFRDLGLVRTRQVMQGNEVVGSRYWLRDVPLDFEEGPGADWPGESDSVSPPPLTGETPPPDGAVRAGEQTKRTHQETKRVARTKTPGSVIAEVFDLTAKRWEYAWKHGMPRPVAEQQIEMFAAWHGSHGSKHVDWDRAWLTWVLRWKDRQQSQAPDEPEWGR